eukprot:2492435-Heterocapsa_arctica.AAC.1
MTLQDMLRDDDDAKNDAEDDDDDDDGYEAMTVKMLNQIAKEKGLTGCSRLRKDDLIERLRSRCAIDQAVGSDTSYRAID